ncbi:MAG: hypothetical protein AAFW75_30055 [Cyanobacteria bacterium J06636_16]
MGLFNFSKERQTRAIGAHGFVCKHRGISFEEAQQARAKFLAVLDQDDESAAFNAATELLISQAFRESITAHTKLLEKYPNRKGHCQSQIGAAYYFLEDYPLAINFYVAARKHGADAEMMDDNIWEACEAIYKRENDKSAIARYKQLCPSGNYRKQASEILAS